MSAPDQLVDPQLAAFAAADPTVLQPPEVAAAPAGHDHTRAEIAAAVLVVCALIVRHLLKQRPASIEEAQHQARSVWQRVAPLWLRLTVPAIKQAYQLGRIAELSEPELQALAEAYAGAVGDYLGQTSADAVVDGFNAQLAGRWSADLAWHRAATAYGLDRQQMRAYIRGAVTGADVGVSDPVPPAARALADKALLIRATRLGEEEAFSAVENGRAIAWMWLAGSGRLPADARRRWITTETDCPICQPMDGVDAPIAEPFTLPDGRSLWAPRAHPGCRCHVELITPEPIEKNTVTDPYDRDTHGRFAPVESRGRLRTLQRDPAIDALLSQIETAPRSLLDTGRKSLLAPSLLSQDSLLGQGSLLEQKSLLGQESLLAQKAKPKLEAAPHLAPHQIFVRIKLPSFPPRKQGDGDPFYLPYYDLRQIEYEASEGQVDEDTWFVRGQSANFTTYLDSARYAAENDPEGDPYYADFEDDEWAEHQRQIAGNIRLTARRHGDVRTLNSVFEAAVYDFWHDEDPMDVNQARLEALDDAENVLAASALSDKQVERIYNLAGYQLGEASGKQRERIKRAAAGELNDRSLADAYADYVTYVTPGLVDGDKSRQLALRLEQYDIGNSSPPITQLFVFDKGFAPGDEPNARGEVQIEHDYVVDEIEYVSSATFDDNDDAGCAGYRLVYVRPE